MHEESTTTYWLWLEMVFGVANVKLLELVRTAGSVRELYYTLHDPDCGLLSEKEHERLRRTSLEQAKAVLLSCEKNGIGIMTWEDALYPDSLRTIYNPPCVLFYRGDPTILQQGMLLTVVGTRHPSDYSLKVANWLCGDLARCNLVLVSGCAVGLDAAAHRAAILANTPTIGVLGCGIDVDYPRENRELKARIVQNGLLLTEYFPGTQPKPAHFPVRNRILAGISEAVLVLEAGARSGSLITANLACEQGKSVFCVPPANLFESRYSGVVNFLRDGAYPVFNYLDVLYAFYLKYPHKLSLYDEEEASRTQDSLLFEKQTEKRSKPVSPRRSVVKRVQPKPQTAPAEPQPYQFPAEATAQQRKILEFLKSGGKTTNAICRHLGVKFEGVAVDLMDMEMAGWIENNERDIYTLPDGTR